MTEATSAPSTPASAPTSAPTGAPSAPQEVSTPSQGNTLLSQTQDDWTTGIPDKFKGESGVNYEAMWKSYQNLEQRLGHDGAYPESPDEYEYEYKPGEDAKITLTDDVFKTLKEKAHSMKLNKNQYKEVVGVFDEFSKVAIDQAIKAAKIDPESQYQEAQQKLSEVWKSPDEMKSNLVLANKAFSKFSEGLDISVDDIGNNPAAIRLLAKIGAGLKEDGGDNGNAPSRESLDQLRNHPAYTNPLHPQHQQIVAKVNGIMLPNMR